MPVRIVGIVNSISESGNLVTDITADQLAGAPRDERVLVRCNDHETNGIFQVDHEQPAMTLIALIGESNCLEVEVVGDNARIMLGVSTGQKVEVCW
ncbi:MAG: adenosylmethionine-8-amino-7-oxononanoate aminotransferase [Pirellulaceae bacterium]|nr:adenosylmethionine-8-amino-7-oxononanoate aminotransferase [Planctomycetaceae bacterium]MDP6466728.1 adenosylmethionine-8-amino-7-oxononanoate aminotransferase [Pirellulaceae bacterium]MDP6556120.1 adenosylmethionine-8-amino-7-oxononanoate aminotransferase [Pirellulaceae bacterium]MDP6721732.1 adenosylmethionine-8-amino-7-oxononanoate aminotransferase [Pirellulaceae bacterium]